jgi:uncharacterized protein (DUF488 family)
MQDAAAARSDEGAGCATIFTVGHSNHSADRLLELLSAAGVKLVADVRRFPHSKRWPQFSLEWLKGRLGDCGIDYLWLAGLGGRRRLMDEDAAYAGWEQAGFRAYAAHMRSEEFQAALVRLTSLARDNLSACGHAQAGRAALMCAEGLWWQCHRRLIADQLLARGYEVVHIMPDGRLAEHVLTPFAVARDGWLTYPAPLQRVPFSSG